MKKLISLLFLLGSSLSSIAQLYLNQRYDFDSCNDWGHKVSATLSDEVIVFASSSKIAAPHAIGVKRIDYAGAEVVSKQYRDANDYHYHLNVSCPTKRTSDGSFIVPFNLWKSNACFVGLVKFDSNGNMLWRQLLSDTTLGYRENICGLDLMPDGGYIIAINSPNNSDNGSLKRYDSNLQLLWSVTNVGQSFSSCEYMGNGEIIAGGLVRSSASTPFYYDKYSPRFFVYDTLGNVLRDTFYNKRYIGGGTIYNDRHGGFYHWGSLDTIWNTQGESFNHPHYLAHVDNNLKIEWTKVFGSPQEKRSIAFVRQLKDGNFLIAGDIDYHLGWAAKVNRSGWVIWNNFYFIDSTWTSIAHFSDCVERSDGSLVFTGRHDISSYGNKALNWRKTDVWIVIVDSNGCIIPNCNPLSVKQASAEDKPITISPNPTSGRFTLEAFHEGQLTVYDINGREVMTDVIKQGKNYFFLPDHLSNGIYTCEIESQKSETHFIKLIYQQ